MRFLPVGLALMSVLSGCAVPTAVSIVSFAADGVSYIATGKSTTDHALSAVAQEDCAMFRALREKPVCVPERSAAPPAAEAKAEPRTVPARPQPEAKAPTGEEEQAFLLIPKEGIAPLILAWGPRVLAKDSPGGPVGFAGAHLVEKGVPAMPRPVRITRAGARLCGSTGSGAPGFPCRPRPGA